MTLPSFKQTRVIFPIAFNINTNYEKIETVQRQNTKNMSKRQIEYQDNGDTRRAYDKDFAALLQECLRYAEEEENAEHRQDADADLTEEQLEIIAGMGQEGLEREYDKYAPSATSNDPAIQKEAIEELQQHNVHSRLTIVDNIPEQAQLVSSTQHQVPMIGPMLEEFDNATFMQLLQEPYWLLAEEENRTKTRVALHEFHRFSKTLIGQHIPGPKHCDGILFSANKTHCRAKEEFTISYASLQYRILFYYIDESIFSALVFTDQWTYKGCFFLQAKECMLRDLLRLKATF